MKPSEELAENNAVLVELLEQGWERNVKGVECLRPGQTVWQPCPTMQHVMNALRHGAILRRERVEIRKRKG